ncbi:MAG: endonuclease/exonuclease/phosphatase family protein [Thermomicrobiales bacterium]|nr:endonuclease/exonuclease/phosphatase family protein [Thermomicrobiales bacterium]
MSGFELGMIVLSGTATLFFLQAFRLFVPYLVFEIDQSQRQQLAAIGGAVFGLAFLGALLYRLAGGRIALWLAVALLLVARLGMQFTEQPGARWMLGATAVIAWSWMLIVFLPNGGNQLSLGIGFAFVADLIIRALRGTVDLPWMPDLASHVVTIVIGVGAVLAAWAVNTSERLDIPEAGFVPSLRYAGIGPGIALWLITAGNIGFAEVQGALGVPVAFGLLALGTIVALAVQLGISARWPIRLDNRLRAMTPGLLSAMAVIVWQFDASRWLNVLALPLFAFAVSAATMRAALATPPGKQHGRWRSGITLTLGLLMQTAFVFLYFARSGPIWLMLAPVAVLALAPLAGRLPQPETRFLLPGLERGIAAVALVAIVAFGWLFVTATGPGTSSAGSGTVTVMDFNIQEGFSTDDIWSLETTAKTIEAHDPDIVFLQEITRGWLVMSSVDQVRWLADRLDMHYVYAGNSHDGLWGNAILSRFPIASERSTVFGTTDNLRRGAVAVEVTTGSGNLLVIATHLDNPRKATAVRLEQIQELITFWGGAKPAIIGGDFNADPGSEEWQAMIDAGFVDAAGADPATTSEDERRIDYLWLTPDLAIDSYTVPDVRVSDHRPVVVTVSKPA